VRDRLHTLKHRLYWLTEGRKLYKRYFEDYRSRAETIDQLCEWLSAHSRYELRVLELGCSGANNLRLMRELVPLPITYVGLDIQREAISFARRQFPDDDFVVGDDRDLPRLLQQRGPFDVFIASSVLSYLPEPRCRAVLAEVAPKADVVLVCDVLSRLDEPTGMNDGLFLHPYARLCDEVGLKIVAKVLHPGNRQFSTFVGEFTG
jgi:SAM-dependent methyltransferase